MNQIDASYRQVFGTHAIVRDQPIAHAQLSSWLAGAGRSPDPCRGRAVT
ncbi:MAG: hypothetical protein AB7E59_13915 [Pusillimonas sp.]